MVSVSLTIFCLSSMTYATESRPLVRETYTFGIVPQQAASKLARLWAPIFQHISTETGVNVRFVTAPSIPEFEERLLKGEYDFAYMNPYHYVLFSDEAGYRAFAKQKDRLITGLLVASVDGAVRSINDLEGKVLAFPSAGAFAASILIRAYLRNSGIAFTPEYVGSHDSVYRNVGAGRFSGGGGINRTLESVAPDVKAKLTTIWKSKGYTPHAFAAHDRVPTEKVDALRDALIALDKTDAGKALLAGIAFKAIESAEDTNWNDIRDLGVTPEEAGIILNKDN